MSLKTAFAKAATLLILLSCTSIVFAVEKGKDYHIVVKGDTLWDISEKYMKNPYFWPKLWQWNDYITNPHFIYPGDKISLVPPKTLARSMPVVEEAPLPAEEEKGEEIARLEPAREEPAPKIKEKLQYNIRHLRSSGMISPEELEAAGHIEDARDEKILLGDGDIVYMALKRVPQIGEILSVFKPTIKIYHPVTGKRLGDKIVQLGHIKVTDFSEGIATGEIIESFNAISRGDRLREYEKLPEIIGIKEARSHLEGRIVAAKENVSIYGQNDVVYIDLGKDKGVDKGFLFTIYRPPYRKGGYTMPAETIGRLLVFQVKEKTSSAVIIDAVEEIRAGEHIRAVLQ